MAIDPVGLAAKALDGLFMRSAALAYNIGNINSPRFQPLEVNFEAALRRAAAGGDGALAALSFGFTAGAPLALGDERREDLMLIDASSNAMRFAALADMTGRRMAIESAAIGGR